MTTTVTQKLSGFNNFPRAQCQVERPSRYRDLAPHDKSIIVRGNGRSYGDAALNENGTVLSTVALNRILAFDREQGVITAEAGILLDNILPVIMPAGWFLPVTPGTRYVTLGGCVATDVHGKNHHRQGSIANYIKWIELITADNTRLVLSPSQSPDLFWATIGGMGLTGIIGTVCLQLQAISSAYMIVKHYEASSLEKVIAYLNDSQIDDQYSVAWLDLLAKNEHCGRGIVMTAHHAATDELPTQLSIKALDCSTKKSPIQLPLFIAKHFLRRKIMTVFNNWYYKKQAAKQLPHPITYNDYFYPLDKIMHWNKLYGQQGFIQYQCVIPDHHAHQAIKTILNALSTNAYPVYLAVLKRFGDENLGLLSFPTKGFTLALDIPILNQQLFTFLDELDDIVIQHQGRIYLAKDARLSPSRFRIMYPRFEEWRSIKKKFDPNGIFNSKLSQRLDMI